MFFYFVLQCFAPFVLYKNLLFCNNDVTQKWPTAWLFENVLESDGKMNLRYDTYMNLRYDTYILTAD